MANIRTRVLVALKGDRELWAIVVETLANSHHSLKDLGSFVECGTTLRA